MERKTNYSRILLAFFFLLLILFRNHLREQQREQEMMLQQQMYEYQREQQLMRELVSKHMLDYLIIDTTKNEDEDTVKKIYRVND